MTDIKLQLWRQTPEFHHRLYKAYAALVKKRRGGYLFVPLADAVACLGKVDYAIKILRKGLKNYPGSRAGKVLLAQLLYDRGKINEARNILEEVVERWPDVIAGVSLLCRIYEKQGRPEMAALVAAPLRDFYPDIPFVKKLCGRYDLARPEEEVTVSLSRGMVSEAVKEQEAQEKAAQKSVTIAPAKASVTEEPDLYVPQKAAAKPAEVGAKESAPQPEAPEEVEEAVELAEAATAPLPKTKGSPLTPSGIPTEALRAKMEAALKAHREEVMKTEREAAHKARTVAAMKKERDRARKSRAAQAESKMAKAVKKNKGAPRKPVEKKVSPEKQTVMRFESMLGRIEELKKTRAAL